MIEQHESVRAGLSRVLSAFPEWRTEPLVLLRNRLLDECGGDARALITLLVRAAELGVPDRITEWGGSGVPWGTLRGALVVTLVADAFLRPEMATWAIESWGAALVGAERLGLERAPSLSTLPPVRGTTLDGAQRSASVTTGSGRSPTARAAPLASRTPRGSGFHARSAAPPVTALPAASTRPPRQATGPATRATTSAWPSAPGTSWQSMTRVAVVVIVLGLGYLVVQVSGAARRREQDRQAQPVATAPAQASAAAMSPGATNGSPALASGETAGRTDTSGTSLSGIARSAIPSAANDPSRLLRVAPPTRARGAVGPGAAVLESQVAQLATTRADRLALRSGRTLTGRVEVVRASVVVFRDAESGLRYEFAKRDIVEITTEFGTTVRFGAQGDPENERQSPLVARGLGGSYRVRYAFEKVQGSAECRATAASGLAPDVMTIEHIPGTDTLTLVLRSGSRYYGVVDAAGLFATALAIQGDQATEASAYTSRINGRFTERGFDGTVNLIAYRRVRSGRDIVCHTTLGASGERIVPGSAGGARQ